MRYTLLIVLMLTGCTATKLHMLAYDPNGKLIHDHTMYRCSIGHKVDCDVKTPDGWIVTYKNDGGSAALRATMDGIVDRLLSVKINKE